MIHDHDAISLAQDLPIGGVLLAMFLAGLAGGLSHCAGMCSGFVLAQVGSHLGRLPAAGFNAWVRLKSAALLPYHLGRMTTYAALGAVAGGLAGVFVQLTAFKVVLSLFLLLAASLFLLQLAAELVPALRGSGGLGPGASLLSRFVAPLFADPRGWRGYALGLTLGFLPCGLIYSALAAAAGSGSAFMGGLAMAAFVAGTAPALVAVGFGGSLAGQRWRWVMRPLARSLMAVNAALLLWLGLGALV
jgi:uncharacterized protein